ncbi:MAG: peptide ABC transporter substrate-binding protein [Ardenticatenaceae bacterium]
MRLFYCYLLLIFTGFGLVACEQTTGEPEIPIGPMVLDYNFGSDAISLDSAFAVNQVSQDVSAQLFEGLTGFDAQSGQIIPALAEDWDVSEDGFTYTFKMHENAFWVNQAGEPLRQVTAADVVYSIRRVCDPAVESPSSHILFVIRGCQDAHESVVIPDLELIGVQELEPFIVEFWLAEPVAYFPLILSLPVARPVPQDVVEAHGTRWTELEHILTNGAFYLNEWQPNEQITLIKNPNYYEAADVHLVRVNGHLLDDVAASKRYLDNQLDAITLSPPETGRLRSMSGLAAQWTRMPESCTYGYGFTLVKPPLDNVRVRRALSMALDRQKLIDQVQGTQLAAYHFAPPFVFGALPLENSAPEGFNLQMAQKLLAEAGYANGQGFPPLTLWHPANDEQAQFAAGATEMWKANLGIEVEVLSLPREQYLALMQTTTPIEEISHIWALGWCADYPDQHNWIYDVFNLNADPQDKAPANRDFEDRMTIYGGGQYIRRTASDFDELTEQAITERDPEKRLALYAQAEQILTVEEAMIAPIYYYTINAFTKPWLQRTYSPATGQSFKQWKIDMPAKEAARNP